MWASRSRGLRKYPSRAAPRYGRLVLSTLEVESLAGHAANDAHGKVYVHREKLPLSLLRDGLEKLRCVEVVKALASSSTIE
jgi:hypothetical protein